jgi:hypothetical protein
VETRANKSGLHEHKGFARPPDGPTSLSDVLASAIHLPAAHVLDLLLIFACGFSRGDVDAGSDAFLSDGAEVDQQGIEPWPFHCTLEPNTPICLSRVRHQLHPPLQYQVAAVEGTRNGHAPHGAKGVIQGPYSRDLIRFLQGSDVDLRPISPTFR